MEQILDNYQPNYQVEPKESKRIMRVVRDVGIFVIIIAAGIGTGYGLHTIINKNASTGSEEVVGAPGTLSANQVTVGKVYGVDDAKKYPDISEGTLEKGGIDGEGTHHLVRPGGQSQTVYLTSSELDLDLFVGHKVQVRGQTFAAQKAAWFMDVGSVKVVELNVSKPAASSATVPAE